MKNLLSVTMPGHSASANPDPPSPARIRRRLSARDLREIARATARLNVAGIYAIEMLGVKVIFHNGRPAAGNDGAPAQVQPGPAGVQNPPPQPGSRQQKRKARSDGRATRRRERLQQQQPHLQHPPGLHQPGDLQTQQQLHQQRQEPQPEQEELQQPAQDKVPPAQDEMEPERAAKRGQPSTPSQEGGLPSPAAPRAKRALVLPGPPPPSLPPSPPSPHVTDGLVATGRDLQKRDASSVLANALVHKPERPPQCTCCKEYNERMFDVKNQWCFGCHQENCEDSRKCNLCKYLFRNL